MSKSPIVLPELKEPTVQHAGDALSGNFGDTDVGDLLTKISRGIVGQQLWFVEPPANSTSLPTGEVRASSDLRARIEVWVNEGGARSKTDL